MNRRGRALSEHRKVRVEGFTLIELLISIVLMIILLSAVTMIFVHTTETVNQSQARTQVYTQARYSMDMLEADLLACLPFTGQQQFGMDNGVGGLDRRVATEPNYGQMGGHVDGVASDRLVFVATAQVANTTQTARFTYYLLPGHKSLNENGVPEDVGDIDLGATVPTPDHPEGRPIYTLIRRTEVYNPATGQYNMRPVDAQGKAVPDMELCRFVTSFNLEYFGSNMLFSQLQPSPFRSTIPPGAQYDPLGNGLGENDGQGENAIPIRVPMIRVTITIVEDRQARQERTIQKVIAIPMG